MGGAKRVLLRYLRRCFTNYYSIKNHIGRKMELATNEVERLLKDVEVERLSSTVFTWSRWRRFDLFESLGMPARSTQILAYRSILRKHMVGYCRGEELLCRPKYNHYAVMFKKSNELMWCHLTQEEFYSIRELN